MIKLYFFTNTKNTLFALKDLSNFSTNQDGTIDWQYHQHFMMPPCLPIVSKIMVFVGIMPYLQMVPKDNTIPMIGALFYEDTRDARISFWKPT